MKHSPHRNQHQKKKNIHEANSVLEAGGSLVENPKKQPYHTESESQKKHQKQKRTPPNKIDENTRTRQGN